MGTKQEALNRFGMILDAQAERIERIKNDTSTIDYAATKPIIIGILGGDGIGPFIAEEAQRVLEILLKDNIASGKVDFRVLEGLTIENRAAHLKAIPDDVLEAIKECHVTLKGPTTTPEKGDEWPNIESCNVAMRKELDLFANVRPVRIPKEGIDWTFFRENTEDVYAVGSLGVEVGELAVDFKVITKPGSRRIIEAAFAHAKKTGKTSVTVVTKANVVKTTDGLFLETAGEVAKNYPGISWEGWYIDIMTAKLLDTKRRKRLPGAGDAQSLRRHPHRRGRGDARAAWARRAAPTWAVSTRCSRRSTAARPRMVREGRAKYADPSSMIRAGAMMLEHIGFTELGGRLSKALDICGQFEKKISITGRDTGCTGKELGDYVVATVQDSSLNSRWEAYVNA